MRQLPHQGSRRLDHLGRGVQSIVLGFSSKKNCGQKRNNYPDHPYLETSHSRKKSSPHLRLIHHKYRHAAVAVDCQSASLSGPTVRPNASITISTARHDRGRGLPCCGSARFGDHALAGLPFDLGQEEEALRPQRPKMLRSVGWQEK